MFGLPPPKHGPISSEKRAFETAMELQAPWVNGLADGLLVGEIATVRRVAAALRRKLEG
jgi:hypothetical protein